MGINCKIVYTKDNEIDYVEAPNGERSILFDNLRAIFGEKKALDLYALTESETLKDRITSKVMQYKNKLAKGLENVRFSIIGEQGATRVQKYSDLLDQAKRLEEQGVSIDEISNQTGWYKQNNQWKYLAPELLKEFELTSFEVNKIKKLKDVLQKGNVILEMYPSMGEIEVVFYDNSKQDALEETKKWENVGATFSPKRNLIAINRNKQGVQRPISEISNKLGHEAVHAIQRLERLAVDLLKGESINNRTSFENIEDFKDILTNGTWGMLTGENPNAKKVSAKKNVENNQKAVEWLKSKGYTPIPIKGKYGNEENSFFVPNLTTEDAVLFAKDLNQESVATNLGYIYQDGTMNPIKKGKEILGGEFEDFYSTINIKGKPLNFKVDYDFESTISTEIISPENSTNYANLTEDNEGNFVFYHVGSRGYETIKKGTGQNKATSREEASALGKVGGLAMYYPAENVGESMFTGEAKYMVKVPKEKVYDYNADPLLLLDKAEEIFRKEFPNQAFDRNNQLAFTTKVAIEQGYDMVVARWDGTTRVQTTKEFAPVDSQFLDGNTISKDFKPENKFESNKDKGWRFKLGETKKEKLKEVYDEIYNAVGSNNYSNPLYNIQNSLEYDFSDRFAPYKSQEEITEKVEKSDLSEELKQKYRDAVAFEDTKGFSYKEGIRFSKAPKLEIQKQETAKGLSFVPTVNGEKAGAIRLSPHKDGYKVDEAIVYDRFQGRGLGTRLYQEAVKDLIPQGKNLYSLNTRTEGADRIWKKFVKLGIARKEGNDYILDTLPKAIDKNGDPQMKELLTYAQETDEKLTKQETVDAIDSAVSLGVKSSSELKQKLEEAFVENGLVVFDKAKLRRAGYNEYEVTKILNSKPIQNKIRKALPKLRNSEFEVDFNEKDLVVTKELSIFGKQIKIDRVKEVTPIKTIKNGELIDKTSDTESVLRKTYPFEPKPLSTKFSNLLSTIRNVREDVANEEFKDVQKVVKGITKEAVDYGVDLRGIENKIYPIKKLKDFVTALESYILNPTNEFANIYDDFFNLTEVQMDSREVSENDIILDTELSEYELFRDYNLVRKNGNVYTQVVSYPLEQLYGYYFERQDKNKSQTDVQRKMSDLEVEDFNIDSDVLEAMYIWKDFLGYPIKTQSNEKTQFIDLKEAIKNPYKKVTTNGVELVDSSSITQAKAEVYEPQQTEEETDFDYLGAIRENPKNIKKITTDYSYIAPDVLATKNNTEHFVRTPQGVFERFYENGNVSFFARVVSKQKNLVNTNMNQYKGMTVDFDDMIKAKKYYTQEELQEINNKYFNCQ